MDKSEDPNDPTPTQPLLTNPPYPSPLDQPSITPHHLRPTTSGTIDDQNQFLQISYNHAPRSFRDLPFLILFSLFVLATFALGIFSSVHRNPHHSQLSSFYYNSSTSSCTLLLHTNSFSTLPNFLSFSKPKPKVLESLIWTLVITLILSVPFVLCVLLLLKHYTKQIVYVSLPLFVIVPLFLDVYWFVACTLSANCSDAFPLAYRVLVLVFVFLIIAVIVWIFIVNWHRIELTVKIIGIASDALSKNLGLFGVLPAMILGLFVYYAPIVVFLVFARFNGKIVPREKRGEYYCVWKEDSWVPAYYALAILTMLWSATAMIEAQVYVISGTIAQWYFSKDDERPKKSLRSALR